MSQIRQIIADLVWPEGAERRNRAEREANTDVLTGIANVRALALAKDAAESDPNIAIIFVDGNDFGLVNKVAGHDAGDYLIQRTARVMSSFALRVFRRGGDEFVAFVPAIRAEAVRVAIEEGFGVVVHNRLRITISSGVGLTVAEAELDMNLRKAERKRLWNNQQELQQYRQQAQENKRRPSRISLESLGATNS